MTEQLEGAELCLAAARVMGALWRAYIEEGVCWVECNDGSRFAFDPINDPAQAWEVLMWVRGKGHQVDFWTRADCQAGVYLCREVEDDSSGIGPTDAIALLRAVAALGEAG